LRAREIEKETSMEPMIVQLVRFKSGLTNEEVVETYAARAQRYRALPGLIQKHYLRFPAAGRHGAVYLWESSAALASFRDSELARSIAGTYRVEGAPEVEIAEVVMVLRPDTRARSGS